MTRLIVGTSWKMNLTPTQAIDWFRVAGPLLADVEDRDLFVLPPFPSLAAARQELAGTRIGYGGQDLHPEDSGAHTGDVSGPMLADLGCRYVEIGHSERRRDHGETDSLIGAKIRAALRWDLTPIVCIGETAPGTVEGARIVVEGQLDAGLGALSDTELDRLVLAYEPMWAIGEGSAAAAPRHVQGMHSAIDAWLAARGTRTRRIVYGGSVDASNAADLLAVTSVGGLFVGRSALDPRTFAAIARTGLP